LTFDGEGYTMYNAKKLRDLQKHYDDIGADFHNGILRAAADEIERYEKWMVDRDNFIVQSGMWQEFLASLEGKDE
jgi:hypothetical protein